MTGDGQKLLLMTHSVAAGTAKNSTNGVPRVNVVNADGSVK